MMNYLPIGLRDGIEYPLAVLRTQEEWGQITGDLVTPPNRLLSSKLPPAPVVDQGVGFPVHARLGDGGFPSRPRPRCLAIAGGVAVCVDPPVKSMIDLELGNCPGLIFASRAGAVRAHQ